MHEKIINIFTINYTVSILGAIMMKTIYKYFVYILFIAFVFPFINAQSIQDLNKMKKEFEQIKRVGKLSNPLTNQQGAENDDLSIDFQQIVPFSSESRDSLHQRNKFFGYDFFSNRDTVSFFNNLPAPPNYIVGPGDELRVSIWGETQISQTYVLSKEGTIYDEKVGLLGIIGKNLAETELYLKNQFSKVYSTMKGSNPSTFIDVSLGRLGFINVNFVGGVKFPGIYPIHPFSNLIMGVIHAGGIDTTASLRKIKIIRDGKEFSQIDLYSYLLKGELPEKIQLRDQDIVVVPPRFSTVTIDSQVYNPGIFEILPNETLNDLIFFAGGMKPTASTKIFIERIIPMTLRKREIPNYKQLYVEYPTDENLLIEDGDFVLISKIKKNLSYVEIIGQVKEPGRYGFFEGMSIKDLIEIGGGFEDSTFTKSIYSKQGEIIRRNPKKRYETIIPIALDGFIENDDLDEIKLQNLDRFVVRENLNFFERQNIIISGEVHIPGSYPIIKDNETLKSVLQRAGGLTNKALKNGISIYRLRKHFNHFSENESEVNEKSRVRVAWSNQSIELMPADSIIVRESTNTVNVSGEVYNQGLIEYKKGKSVGYYINRSGGITSNGDKNKIIVVYPNGEVAPKKWYNSPKIEDGSNIYINLKETQEPFNLTQFATNWTSILSSLITAVVLSQQISN